MEQSNPPAPGLLSPDSLPSPLWSRASSSSSLSSSFRAESFDFRGYPPQSELEEVPSLRWLPADLRTPAGEKRVFLPTIEEDGVRPLLKLVQRGPVEEQEHAAEAIGLLGRDPESVNMLLAAGVCPVFASVLRNGPTKAQARVAWAVSELAGNYPMCQDLFAQYNVVHLLVSHLTFETVQEHSKGNGSISKQLYDNPQRPVLKGREAEDPATKADMNAMAAKALWQLARGNAAICKRITETKALLCFAVLLEKGPDEAQYNSAMALMEIARMAEEHVDLRRSAFKPNSPAAKAVVDQMLKIIEKGESGDLLPPCVTAIGCLSRTFRATETRIIGPLVRLLDERKEDHITREAVVALTKFASNVNYLYMEHSRAIISAGGAKHLIQLVYHAGQLIERLEALALLCYIALHVPEDEALAQADVLSVLEWASKQPFMAQERDAQLLLAEAKYRLELYQSRGSRGFD